jgi:hypothetical protein
MATIRYKMGQLLSAGCLPAETVVRSVPAYSELVAVFYNQAAEIVCLTRFTGFAPPSRNVPIWFRWGFNRMNVKPITV